MGGKVKMLHAELEIPTQSRKSVLRIYRILYGAFGPCNWWPGDTPFEVIIGAILTQNANWSNVEKAIANLKKKNLLDPVKLHNTPKSRIADLVRPAGYFRQKAKKIHIFLDYFKKKYDYSIEKMKEQPADKLRRELLNTWGIGPETADSILLYALEKPVFVVDAYTMRIFRRLGYINSKDKYETVQKLFTKCLTPEVSLFNEFHACIVALGSNVCRPKPLCDRCPLSDKIFCHRRP